MNWVYCKVLLGQLGEWRWWGVACRRTVVCWISFHSSKEREKKKDWEGRRGGEDKIVKKQRFYYSAPICGSISNTEGRHQRVHTDSLKFD